jgi:hypothetical protein
MENNVQGLFMLRQKFSMQCGLMEFQKFYTEVKVKRRS